MPHIKNFTGKRAHMIGIGGSSMSGLAGMLMQAGVIVTGSDGVASYMTKMLEGQGIPVTIGHFEKNVHGADLIIYSAAISAENPERAEATRLGIPQMERATLLGQLMEGYRHAINVCGTHGKTTTTSMLAKALLDANLDPTVHIGGQLDYIGGRVPVIAGTGSNDTAYAIELTKYACEAGADAMLLVTPYYNKTTPQGAYQHYKAITESVALPIILYNVPSRTGVAIKPETYKELSKHPNIVATKEAGEKVGEVAKIISMCGGDLDVYTGCDDLTVPVMSLGGIGVISVFANVCPKEMHQITQYCLDGNFAEATKMHLHYLELMNALFCDVNPIPVKEAVNMLGFNAGICRLPLVPMSEKSTEYLKSVMAKHNLVK